MEVECCCSLYSDVGMSLVIEQGGGDELVLASMSVLTGVAWATSMS